jgi:hypothetical protein
MNLRQVSWMLYIVGFALVAGSWFNIVSSQVGWIGFGIGIVSWAMAYLPGYRKASVSEELERLADLKRSGAIDEREFQEAKEKVLAGEA